MLVEKIQKVPPTFGVKPTLGVKPRHVQTTINYYRDPGDGTEHAPSIAGKRSTFNQPSIELDTLVTDITGSEDQFTLDSHGFQLVDSVSRMKVFDNDDRIKEEYYPEVEQLVREV
jgi:hypothetical protein